VSNYLAIATATAGLMQIIEDGLENKVSGAEVKSMRPSAPAANLPNPGVTVFLYQVTPNLAYRNTDLPNRNHAGDVVQRPRVALDLHYLLTFHGEDGVLMPQRLLGCTAVALHSQPQLSRALIHRVIQEHIANNPSPYLATSDLEHEVELVKFTPLSLSLEELSKLWSVFFQTAYSLSMAYLATVVLIESEETTQPALPVLERHLLVMPFRQPVIDSVDPQMLNPGARLTIKGRNLKSDALKVVFNGTQDVVPPPAQVKDREITVDAPAILKAGVNIVQVVHGVDFKTPQEPHQGFESNAGVFMVRPVMTAATQNLVSSVVNTVTFRAGEMHVVFTNPVGRRQRVILLLNQRDPPPDATARAYTFPAPAGNGITDPKVQETDTIDIPFEKVVAGVYLVRVRVDEAESELVIHPMTKKFDSPWVDI
jgi:hypothetical protein